MEPFIPKYQKKEQITVRIGSERLMRLDHLAEKTGLSRSDLVDQCVAFALDHLSPAKIQKKEPARRAK